MRLWMPRPTVRLRLTLIYGGLFLVSGIGLLGVTFLLFVNSTNFTFHGPNGESLSFEGAPPPGALGPTERQAVEAQAASEHQLLVQSGIALAIMVVLSVGLGWLMAGRVLAPLRTITTKVQNISVNSLHERLALDGPDDELKELGDTFDGLLARLDAAFQAQRRFVANASHELRTPLARQRTLAQVALADPDADVESLRSVHERVLASGAEQERLIDALLTLAKGQAGVGTYEPFDLAEVAGDVLLARQAESDGLDVDTRLQPAPTRGDRRLVAQLVANLVDNAVRHNNPSGWVEVYTSTRDGRAVLVVSNSGPVVPEDEVERLFEPFRRLGVDRTNHADGHGLGLSIVRAIALAHKANLAARAHSKGGLEIEITFGPATSTESLTSS